MEYEFFEIDMELLKRVIHDFVRTVSSSTLQSQVEDRNALIAEFLIPMSKFLEEQEIYINEIVKLERNYQEVLRKYEAFQKEVMERQESILATLKQLFDDMFKGLNKMYQCHIKKYEEAYGVVQKDILQKFEQSHNMQQQKLAQFKKKIFTMLM